MSNKRILWGYIWKTTSESLDECIELFWPTMGRNWTKAQLVQNFRKAKEEGTIGKNAKMKSYRVVLEEIEP